MAVIRLVDGTKLYWIKLVLYFPIEKNEKFNTKLKPNDLILVISKITKTLLYIILPKPLIINIPYNLSNKKKL